MTAPINLEEAYNELSNLLKDVCSFLNTEVRNGALNLTAANQAQKLVQRLKKQEEVISKISALQESMNSNYPYLHMQGPNLVEEHLSEYVDAEGSNHYEEEYEETENYAFIENEKINVLPPSIIFEDSCPYSDLPLSQLANEAIKCGPLIRKERLFIIEQKKQLIVGLVGYWLLIYSAHKKDMKPQVVNLTEYKAQPKKEPVFEIVCENKKSHEFIAKSAKDMDQWIVAINCKKTINPNARNLPNVPSTGQSSTENMSESFEHISNSTTNNNLSIDEPEDIYENVDDIKKAESIQAPIVRQKSSDDEGDAPKLPARQTISYMKRINPSTQNSTYNNIPVSSKIEIEEEDNTYDPVQNGEIEEDDEIYDEPKIAETFNRNVNLPEKTKPPEVKETKSQIYDNEDEDCSYDIPRSDNFTQKTNDEYEDEDVEYDELKIIPQNNNERVPFQPKPKPDLKVDTTPEKNKLKPVIISPKPKVPGKLGLFIRKSTSSNNDSQEGGSNKGIHNIIQQMEQSLTFKGKN